MVDYSKWAKIEVSDDEDDTHPNIDTGSLFRWRHQARVEKMDVAKIKRENYEKKKKQIIQDLEKAKENYENSSKTQELKDKLDIELKKYDDVIIEGADLLKEEKKQAWNVDTISKPGFDSSKITGYSKPEEFNIDNFKDFIDKYKTEIQYFGMLHENAESRSYLLEHNYLVCENSASYLCIWSIDMVVEEKWNLFNYISHQAIVMQFILEIKKTVSLPINKLVDDFFIKLNKNLPEFKTSFDAELDSFKIRAKERAKIRLEEAMKDAQEIELKDRIGPGGLDPIEVMESLPIEMQQCFEKRDIQLLQDLLNKMDPNEAEYHMKRCVDSGLWNPGSNE